MWHSCKSENISEAHYSLKNSFVFFWDLCMLDLAGKLHEIMDNGLSGIYYKWCWIPEICAQGKSIDYSLNYALLAWCEVVIWFRALVHSISQLWVIFWYTEQLPLFICKNGFRIVPSLMGDMITKSKECFSVLTSFDLSTTVDIAEHLSFLYSISSSAPKE